MKRYLKYMTALAAGVMLGGCTLDLDPRSSVTFEHFFRNEDDLYSLVAEMHGELRETLTKVPFQEHMGAQIDWINAASQFEKLRNLDPNVITSRTSQQQWRRYYNVLTLTDLFMDNYKKAKDVEPSRLRFCVGQCYFMRSVCYLWLGRTWGDAVITKGSLYTEKYTKTPAAGVIDTAIYYGLKAYEILPKYSEMRGIKGKTLTSRQYGCKGSAAAVLAHLYAWKGSMFNNSEALGESVKWASKLLDPQYAEEIGTSYKMAANPEEVCTKVMLRDSEESIFEVDVDFMETDFSQFELAVYLLSYPIKRNSKPQDVLDCTYGITLGMVNDLYANGDKRRTSYFFEPDNMEHTNSAGLAYLNKWRNTLYREVGGGDPAQFRNLDCNKVIFRLADIQLLRAECRVKLGDTSGAIEDLNVVRSRAGADVFPAGGETAADLQRLVFRERERELLLEGQRYYDVVRNGNEYVRTYLSEGFRELSDADIQNGALYLPIPESAFNNNDLMIQNTYWASKMK